MEIILKDGTIINVEATKKQVKYLRLKIKSSGLILLSIPLNVSTKNAYKFVVSKSEWVLKNLEKCNSINKAINENEVRILGNNYPIFLFESTKNKCIFENSCLKICYKPNTDWNIVIKKWKKQKSELLFTDILNNLYPIVESHGAKMPTFSVRDMKSIWGSCSVNKCTIRLNLRLYATPIQCVEYVILHELAHLIYPNHGMEFKNFLTMYMPDWRLRRKSLAFESL